MSAPGRAAAPGTEASPVNSTLPLTVRIDLPPALQPHAGDAGWKRGLAADVAEQVGRLAADLGIRAQVDVDLHPAAAGGRRALHGLRVSVGGTLCRLARDQLPRVHASLRGTVFGPASVEEIEVTLADPAYAARLVATLAREAVARDPAVLLGDAPLAAAAAALGVAAGGRARLREVLSRVLAQAVSIAALAERRDLAAALADDSVPASALAETLIADLQPASVDILMPTADLRRLTAGAGSEARERYALLRDGLFYEAGLRLPDLRFVEDDGLPSGTFAFRVNALRGLPWIGLADDERLVGVAPERAGRGARSAFNPYTGARFAVAPLQRGLGAETTWTPFEYVVLCLGAELRRLAPRLIGAGHLAQELDRADGATPRLLRCAQSRYRIDQLVDVLRHLAREGLSFRDLRLVLTSLVDFDTIVTDPSELIVVDERLPVPVAPPNPPPTELLLAGVRMAHKRYLTHKLSGGSGSLSALLVDPQLEREIRRRADAGTLLDDADWCDDVIDAFAAEAPAWGDTTRPPCVLTGADVRFALRRLLAQELPHLPVVSYQELAADASISVAARIAPPARQPDARGA
jgi:hypothetical protein